MNQSPYIEGGVVTKVLVDVDDAALAEAPGAAGHQE